MLYYVPYPVIPFAGSRFRSRTDIFLRSSSKLIFGEIFTCGRDGMGERFAFSEFSSRTEIFVDGKPVFLDNSRLFGSGSGGGAVKGCEVKDCDVNDCEVKDCEADFSGPGFFEGYSCQGVFFLFGFDDVPFPEREGIEAAVSKSSAGFTIRALGKSADSLYRFAGKFFHFCQGT
jgi:urease accessory protein